MDGLGYFDFFLARGRGRGSPRRQEGAGVRFFIENPREGGGRGEGREGVGEEFGGGRLNIYFGAEIPTKQRTL